MSMAAFTPSRLRAGGALLLLGAAPLLAGADVPAGTQWAQLTIHERIVIRIPRVSAPAPTPAAEQHWTERRAKRCVATKDVGGAQIGRDGVDFIMSGVRRLRAKLAEDCPTLDFYSGFYVRQAEDGKICAGRDVIRSRSGAQCAIREFRTLVAAR